MEQARLRPQGWRKTPRSKPIAGKPDPFIMESAKAFAAGKIDRDELSYRLRHGYAKRKDYDQGDS